jgi:protease I
MNRALDGVRVVLLIAPAGTEEPEFVEPRRALTEAGAIVTVASLGLDDAKTVNHDLEPGGTYPVDTTVARLHADDFEALIIPGGTVGADHLRADDDVVALVRAFAQDDGKVLAAICHAPWALAEAGVIEGRRVTSYPSLATDLRNAGATWVDEEVVIDGGMITSRRPDDLPAFSNAVVDAVASRRVPA